MKSMLPLPPGAPTYQTGFRSKGGTSVSYQPEWVKQHVLEDDGLCPLLYHYLHKNIKGREHALSSIRLPETVVFDHNFPRSWYAYDSENNEIIKRSGKMLDAQTIYNYFSKSAKDCDIVAQFFYMTVKVEEEWKDIMTKKERKHGTYDGQSLTYVEFFTAQSLYDFLFSSHRKPDGVLQKFMVPKGDGPTRRNFQLFVMWSPLMTTVYKRTNRHRLNDYSFPVSTRASTYDGESYHSEEALVADETKRHLTRLCQDIVEHFSLTERKDITRLNLFFKTDDNNQMWLLWCSSVRVAADSLNPSNQRVPVMWSMRTEVCNDGQTTKQQLQRRRTRQKQLLALDYELFQVTHDFQFAVAMNASHRRQAKALDLKGLKHVDIQEGSKDPRRNPQHPLHESFVRICSESDLCVSPRNLGHPESSSANMTDASFLTPREDRPSDRATQVKEELVALAMDAWYSIYSSTLSDQPMHMPTSRVELAPPLVHALSADELDRLMQVLGLLHDVQRTMQVEAAASADAPTSDAVVVRSQNHGTPAFFVIASHLVGAGRRLDRPSAQVESEVVSFFENLFETRQDQIVEKCLADYHLYFDL